jgi:A118 family predicted phage portal protein
MLIKDLWNKILSLFKVKTQTTDEQENSKQFYNNAYEDIVKVNFNAIFSNKLSNYVANESTLSIKEDNKRAMLLNDVLKDVDKKKKKIVNRMLGTGGVVLIPYAYKDRILFNIIPQFRLNINEVQGEKIVNATILSDIKIEKVGYNTKMYYRWTNQEIVGNNIVIEQKYTDENGDLITKPEVYKDIQDRIVIANVDRCLFGFLKSPVDNRKSSDDYGVPITYGCGSTINEIYETLDQIRREYRLKEAFVGADKLMFNGEDALPMNGLYRKVDSGDDTFWEVFDPAIRDTSYYNRLQEQYARLEKQVGTSKGILTEVETTNATATEIRRAMYDTYTIVEDTREQFEKGLNDFMYACDVYANYYNMGPMGEYEINYDWSYNLLENTKETWEQLVTGKSNGVVKDVELRQFLYPSETIEEAEEAIAEIKANSPSIKDLLGIE